MKNSDVINAAYEKIKMHKTRSNWYKAMSVIACVVIFCTVYSLIMPAITLEVADISYEGHILYCTQTEHSHIEECYEKNLPCEMIEEPGHIHDDECYSPVLMCGKSLQVRHSHEDSCYQSGQQLICKLDETEMHTHTEECLGVVSKLSCGKKESTAHFHTDSCKTTENQLTCITAVEDPAHIHTEGYDACYYLYDNNELDCEESHEHTGGCFIQYRYYNCTLHVHSKEDGCYTMTENITCGFEETAGHNHTDTCFTEEEGTVCGKEETEGHTHSQENNCYTEMRIIVCGMEEMEGDHLEHEATCYDYAQTELICEQEETNTITHEHTDECYETTGICKEEEHVHNWDCYTDPETLAYYGSIEHFEDYRLSHTIARAAEVPTLTEFEDTLMSFESETEMESYYRHIVNKAKVAYLYWQVLPESDKVNITNIDDIIGIKNYDDIMPFAADVKYNIYSVNNGDENSFALVVAAGNTVRNTIINTYKGANTEITQYGGFRYWTMHIITDGIVTNTYSANDVDKRNINVPTGINSTTADDYAVIWHTEMPNPDISMAIGDKVSLSVNPNQRIVYTGSPVATITVTKGADEKYVVDKSADSNDDDYNLQPIENSLSTYDNIRINLYDYNSNINKMYNSNKLYPGFQQGLGKTNNFGSVLTVNDFNFGDNIASDMGMGVTSITSTGANPQGINKVINTFTNTQTGEVFTNLGNANVPVQGTMSKLLNSNGEPQLIGGQSLGYLFTHNTSNGVEKINTDNIDGLLKIYNNAADKNDEYNGNYFFDSRINFAQFNSSTNTFDLYAEYFTPNYMMYPFGNFMPLNNINTQTRKVADITAEYIDRMAGWAEWKSENGYRVANRYSLVAEKLRQFNALMRKEFGANWSGYQAADKYFSLAGIPTTGDVSIFENMYNLDFDEESNFFFGMSLEMDFLQPKDGMYQSEAEYGGNRDAMKFNFAGDDDVWIYIDGILFLDLSGIHRHVGGEIDFCNGKVYYYKLDPGTGNINRREPVGEYTFEYVLRQAYAEKGIISEAAVTTELNKVLKTDTNGKYTTFKDYTNHDFKMYYMERGSGSSVCRINFNMPVIKDNTIGVMKQVNVDEAGVSFLGSPWYDFQIFKADTNGNKTENLLVPEGAEFEVFDLYGQFLRTDTVGPNGVFHIKADEIAEFPVAENAGKYFVRELIPDKIADGIEHVSVGGTEQTNDSVSGFPALSGFEGFDSNVKDVSEGTTIFTYINTYDVDHFGGLAITKTVSGATDDFNEVFIFQVTLDGEKLPDGTAYTLKDKNGEVISSANTVGKDSTVTVGHQQTAVITGIAAGSRFQVQEIGTTEYSVSYSGEGVDAVSDYATGIILPAPVGKANIATVQLNIINHVADETIVIPVSKVLNNFDGTDREFKFKLEQVTSAGTDATAVTGTPNIFYNADTPDADTAKYIEITATADTAAATAKGTGQFEIPLSFEGLISKGYSLPATLYFRITETTGGNPLPLVGYDDSSYIVSVPLEVRAGKLKAGDMVITGGNSIIFTNTLLDNLKISKTAIGGSEDDEFTFTLSVTDGGSAFTDTLVWSKSPVKDDEPTTGTIAAENGMYTFTLRHNQTITIGNMPVGSDYQITETNSDGYHPAYRINTTAEEYSAGAVATGTLTWIVNSEQITDHVEFENRAGTKMPQTGGIGTTLYTSGGILLAGVSLILGYGIKKRRIY